MATSFPTGLDALTNPTGSSALTSPDHAGQHADINDAVEALEAKVGVNSSAVTSSLDYKIANIPATSITTGTLNNSRLPAAATTITSVGTLSALNVTGLTVGTKNFGNTHFSSFAAKADSSAQGLLAGYSFYPTFVGTGDNDARRGADIYAGYNGGAWGTEYLSFGVGTGASNDVGAKTTERMRIDGAGNVGIGTSSPSQTLDVNGGTKSNFYEEKATVSATAATGTIAINAKTTGITYYTTNATANFVLNLRGDSSTTLSSLTAIGDTITISFLNTNGTTAYYPTSIQVDGTVTGVTTKWQGGTAPSTGNASSIDSYVFMVIKTGASTYTVLASQTKFA